MKLEIDRSVALKTMAKGDETAWDINPKDIKKVIAQDKYDDCVACRVTGRLSSYVKGGIEEKLTCFVGTLALVGLGGWSYYSGMKNLRLQEQAILKSGSKYRMGSRRLGVVTISSTLVGMGVWRALH
jgi:hypothetical protein